MRSFLSFLEASASRAMGCFGGFFRDGGDDDEDGDCRRQRPLDSGHHNVIVLQNCLSGLLLSEGGHESQCKVGENPELGSPEINELSEEECSDEAVTPIKISEQRPKSVRFKCGSGKSSSTSSSDSKSSPFPTPVKLSAEMQTPGTAFMTNIEDVVKGKKTRIRSQYVYPVLNPVKVVSSNSNQLSSETSARKEPLLDANVEKLILFGDYEEDDTALSQFQSSVHHAKPVVSF